VRNFRQLKVWEKKEVTGVKRMLPSFVHKLKAES